MQKLNKNYDSIELKTGKVETACIRYGLGKNTMKKVAEEAGAVIRIGKCYLINFDKVDEYMNKLSGNGDSDNA